MKLNSYKWHYHTYSWSERYTKCSKCSSLSESEAAKKGKCRCVFLFLAFIIVYCLGVHNSENYLGRKQWVFSVIVK
jgi:hypothetical protein